MESGFRIDCKLDIRGLEGSIVSYGIGRPGGDRSTKKLNREYQNPENPSANQRWDIDEKNLTESLPIELDQD